MAKWLVYVDPSSVPSVSIRSLKGGPQLCCLQDSKEGILGYMARAHLKADLQSCVRIPGDQPMISWVFPPGQVGIGPQPFSSGAATGHSPEVCLPLLLLSASSL